MTTRWLSGLPPAQGLYDPQFEHDSCGIGFVAHLRGERSHDIVRDGLDLLTNLAHRGAVGGDAETGDGAGMLIQIPHPLLRRECHGLGISLPHAGEYGVGVCFLPTDSDARVAAESIVESCAVDRGWRILGWRDVPTDDTVLGGDAYRTRPAIRHVFVAPAAPTRDADDPTAFERELYVLRRTIERALRAAAPNGERVLYVASLSSRTIVYKGLLRAEQLARFYRDLDDAHTVSGSRDGSLALRDEHLSVVGAGAPVSRALPQRRDQHAARQPHLVARSRGAVRLAALWRRHARTCFRSFNRIRAIRHRSTTSSSC